jgi:ABC-2 type transport system permease protein
MRTLRVLLRFWKASLDAELEYRTSFFIQALASLGNLAGSGFSLWLFYRGGGGFPGWSLEEGTLVLGLFTIFVGVVGLVLSPNLSRIVQHVEQGTLDFVLLKPIDTQLHVSLRHLSPWGVPDLAFGFALVGYALAHVETSAWRVLVALVPLGAGVIILYALWFSVATTTMWFTKIYNATEVLRGLLDAGRYPMAAYPAAYRFVFTFIVPIAFLTTVPAEAILGRGQPGAVLISVGVAAVAFLVARRFFLFALKSYTGASG